MWEIQQTVGPVMTYTLKGLQFNKNSTPLSFVCV